MQIDHGQSEMPVFFGLSSQICPQKMNRHARGAVVKWIHIAFTALTERSTLIKQLDRDHLPLVSSQLKARLKPSLSAGNTSRLLMEADEEQWYSRCLCQLIQNHYVYVVNGQLT